MMGASTRHLSHLLLLVSLSNWRVVDSFGTSSINPTTSSVIRLDDMICAKVLLQDRQTFLSSLLLATGLALGPCRPAYAAYGETSTMELPNYIEYLLEKNAVADPDTYLYKGPDPKVQLQRLLEANKRLEDIPPLASDKKWSQVQGILTGPLGTLAQTLSLIAKDATPDVQAKAKAVKETIFSINTAASQKNEAEVVAKTQAARAKLEAFVRAAF
jgi:hypothetical protein